MTNLVEGLTNEILRVTEIYNQYLECAGGESGIQKLAILLPAQMIKVSIDKARQIQGRGSLAEMISALKELQEIEG